MSLIPIDEFERLATYQCDAGADACVSITLPTHRASNESEQDRIRLKNLVDDAADLLKNEGISEGDIRALLDPVREQLIQDAVFWQYQRDGLCVYRSDEMLVTYRLPVTFKELVTVGPRFHLKPLLPILSADGQFYLMTLHKDAIDVYVGTKYQLTELEISDLPEDLEDLMADHDLERPQQWHTDTRFPGGHPQVRVRPAAFHGHGVIEQHEEVDILGLYRRVDEALTPNLGDEEIPLLLVGEDELVGLYEEATTYPYLVDDAAIYANPAGLSKEQLHAQAWEILAPRFNDDRDAAQETYKMLAGKGDARASDDVEEVVSAAYFERVALLFVARDEEQWGRFEPDLNRVELDAEQTSENQDLLQLAALHTLKNGGTVYTLDSAEMPAEAPVAAVFRY